MSSHPPRILVAEPSRTLAALIRASLAELSAEVEVCADGAQALSAARQRTPDVLVCDEKTSGLDGYALAHAMKQLGGDRRVQTLLMVPEHGHPDPERLDYVGVHDVLVKPFERAVLLERVRSLLPAPAPRLALPQAVSPGPITAAMWERPAPAHEVAHAAADAGEVRRMMELVERRLAEVDAQLEHRVESRLAALLATRLPSAVDAALTRLLPTMIEQAVDRAVARAMSERVPAAVEAVVDEAKATLGALASTDEVERLVRSLAQDTVTTTLGREVLTLVPEALAEVKAHIEKELLTRLDRFARTELPQKLTSHAEQIVWKVVPTIAEDLVREELKRLTAE